jgi:hypothetical protein
MRVDDYRNNINCFGVFATTFLPVRTCIVKAIFCLLAVLVLSSFGASAFELSTRNGTACRVLAQCD